MTLLKYNSLSNNQIHVTCNQCSDLVPTYIIHYYKKGLAIICIKTLNPKDINNTDLEINQIMTLVKYHKKGLAINRD